MTDPIYDITQGHDDIAEILRVSDVDGRPRPLAELAWERICLEDDDGLKGTDYGATRVSGSGVSTDDAPGELRLHRANHLRAEFARRAARMRSDADWFYRITQAKAPRLADSIASREAAASNSRTERCCYHCAGHGYAHVPAKSITDCARVRSDNTIAAKLPEKVALCSWCQGAFDAVHRLPTKDEADLHHGGHIVRWPAGERYAAKLAMAVQQTRVVESERWSGGKAS